MGSRDNLDVQKPRLELPPLRRRVDRADKRLRTRLQQALDRRFYHSRDNMAALIEEFSREIPRLIQRDELLRKVGNRLRDLLELPRAAPRAPWAYVKVAEGCDRTCAFCAIPGFRGRQRSRPLDAIEHEARTLVDDGVVELVRWLEADRARTRTETRNPSDAERREDRTASTNSRGSGDES